MLKNRPSVCAHSSKAICADCGAGIGRVSKLLLLPLFSEVDLEEQNPAFLEKARVYLVRGAGQGRGSGGTEPRLPREGQGVPGKGGVAGARMYPVRGRGSGGTEPCLPREGQGVPGEGAGQGRDSGGTEPRLPGEGRMYPVRGQGSGGKEPRLPREGQGVPGEGAGLWRNRTPPS